MSTLSDAELTSALTTVTTGLYSPDGTEATRQLLEENIRRELARRGVNAP